MVKTKEILSRLLKEKGVTVRELTRGTGLSHQAVYNILNNENHRPHNTTIKKLADYFDITPAQLLGDEPLDEGRPAADGPSPFEVARRLEILEKKIAAGEVPRPTLTDADRERLREKYIRRGLVALRTERLDAAALEALYFVLWKVERAEEGTYGGTTETDTGEGGGT